MKSAKKSALLSIHDLHVSAGAKHIIGGFNLEVKSGEIHAIMGPNGSGKSTLVSTLMGHPAFTVTKGSVKFAGKNLFALETHERAKAGLFLAFQYPKEIAGVTLRSFLFAAYKAQMRVRHSDRRAASPIKFNDLLMEHMATLHMDTSFADRPINQGFSGGEKKKAEVLQMRILEPVVALLDETDSGLDIDALRTVAAGIEDMRSPKFSAIVVTHYARLLHYLRPDFVHVMIDGRIVDSGDRKLAKKLEKKGYKKYISTK